MGLVYSRHDTTCQRAKSTLEYRRSLQRHGTKVPEDISLVGFDDREEALLMDPPLSTVRVHKEEIGETCMKMLLERLHHPRMTFSHRILPTEFVIRGTVRQL